MDCAVAAHVTLLPQLARQAVEMDLTAAQFAAIHSGLLAAVPTFGKILLSQSNRPGQAQLSLRLKIQWRGKVAIS